MKQLKKYKLNTFLLWRIVLWGLIPTSLFGGKPVTEKVDRLHYPDAIKIMGVVGQRLDASYEHRILAQDVDRLVAPFEQRTETRCWQSEFWGKWFTSAVLAYRYRPEARLKAVLDDAVDKLIATQTSDGYIGNYADSSRLEQWDIWGRKYCMLGLLDYYDLTGSKKSLRAAAKEADNLMADLAKKDGIIVTKGNYRGMAASSVLEPISLLYARTHERKYLDFAEEIVRQWETPEGPQLISKASVNVAERFPKPQNWYSLEQGQKAYEMMSCYEGLLELYRLTGKEKYKEAVEKTWQNIKDTEINIAGSGAAVEMWFGGKAYQTNAINHYQETCVTVTWMKLSHQLLRLTGKAKYADAVEQAYYNALLGSMSVDGAQWAKYTPLAGERLPGSEQCGMGLNCCDASGPRGLFNVPLHAVMRTADGLTVNYFMDGEFKLSTPSGQKAVLYQQTTYPISGKIALHIELPKSEKMKVRLRIPTWSEQSALTVNGEIVKEVKAGDYVSVERVWKEGDQLELQLDMRGRIERFGQHPQYVAVCRGPIVLTRDSRLPGPSFGTVAAPIMNKEGFIELKPAQSPTEDVWMQYTALFLPESYKEGGPQPIEMTLCDYASAGNGKDKSVFQVWIPQLIDPKEL